MVDIEVELSQYKDGEKFASAKMDVNEIISRVHDFVDNIKETSLGDHRVTADVDNFNFSVGKSEGNYKLKLNVSFLFAPKNSFDSPKLIL